MKRTRRQHFGFLAGALVLVVLQFTFAHILADARLIEHLLAPGSQSNIALAVAVIFFVLRISVLVVLPGWLLAWLWLWASKGKRPGPNAG